MLWTKMDTTSYIPLSYKTPTTMSLLSFAPLGQLATRVWEMSMQNFILTVLPARASWYVHQISFRRPTSLTTDRMQQMHPPLMDTVTVTAMLYRISLAFNL